MADNDKAILVALEAQHESIGRIEVELIAVRKDQRDCADRLAKWDGGFKGIMLALAAAVSGLTLWFKFKSS